MRRDKVSTRPLVKVFGKVVFEAKAWTPSYINGSIEDNDNVVHVFTGGWLDSNQPVHYTNNAFTVANEQTRHDSERTVNLSPYLEALLNKRHCRLTTELHLSDSSGGTGTDISSVSSVSGDTGDSGTEDGDDTHVDSGVQAARDASKKLPLPRHLTTHHRVSKRILDVLKKVKLQQGIKSNSVSNLLKGSARHHPIKKQVMACAKDPRMKRATWALQPGEPLTGTVRPIEGRSALRPGADGSLRLGKKHQAPASSDNGGGEGSDTGVMQTTTLLASDPETLRKVLGMQKMAIRHAGGNGDQPETKTDTIGGWLPRARRVHRTRLDNDNSMSWRKHETAGGWLPWARRQKRDISDNISDSITRAPANPEEVCISVPNKACAKVKVDGTTVLPKSGRYKWDWANLLPWKRPAGDGYHLHATETGLEVRLGEGRVWVIDADEWMG